MLVCDRRVPAIAGTRPTVVTVMEDLGRRVSMAEDGPLDLAPYDVVMLQGNPGYFPRLRRQLKRMAPQERPLIVALMSEPLPPSKASGVPRETRRSRVEIAKILLRDWRATDIGTNARTIRRMMDEGTIDLLFTASAESLEYLLEEGYPAAHVPYGYHPSYGGLLGGERDVDVLFLGDTRPPRRRELLDYLAREGVEVTVRGSWHDPGMWGEERTRFLNRTKIIVHLQRYQGRLASKRFILAMTNGVMVVSEPVSHPAPFVDGEHFVAAPVERMPAVIRHLLDNPAERDRIAAAGHALVTTELTYARSVGAMLEAIDERLASRERRSPSDGG